jgi:hypothetical protein
MAAVEGQHTSDDFALKRLGNGIGPIGEPFGNSRMIGKRATCLFQAAVFPNER